MAKVQYMGTGRRKKSVARVRLVPGEGRVIVNNREIETYFGLETLRVVVNQPLVLTETKDKYDVLVNVHGGGLSGQAGAIRHGISRALLKADENLRPELKKAGFLTRDPRMVERKQEDLHNSQRDNILLLWKEGGIPPSFFIHSYILKKLFLVLIINKLETNIRKYML